MFKTIRSIAARLAAFDTLIRQQVAAEVQSGPGPFTRQRRRHEARQAEKTARRQPQRTGLAHRVCQDLLTRARPRTLDEQLELLRRLPRNRAEARRYIATKGALARA